ATGETGGDAVDRLAAHSCSRRGEMPVQGDPDLNVVVGFEPVEQGIGRAAPRGLDGNAVDAVIGHDRVRHDQVAVGAARDEDDAGVREIADDAPLDDQGLAAEERDAGVSHSGALDDQAAQADLGAGTGADGDAAAAAADGYTGEVVALDADRLGDGEGAVT